MEDITKNSISRTERYEIKLGLPSASDRKRRWSLCSVPENINCKDQDEMFAYFIQLMNTFSEDEDYSDSVLQFNAIVNIEVPEIYHKIPVVKSVQIISEKLPVVMGFRNEAKSLISLDTWLERAGEILHTKQ